MGLWGAVWLEKPVDSLTRRIFPTTKLRFDPVLLSSGPGMAKKFQENHRNLKNMTENHRNPRKKAGLRSILVVGARRLVSESIGFSSQTGPPEAQTDPQDPQTRPPGEFEKM